MSSTAKVNAFFRPRKIGPVLIQLLQENKKENHFKLKKNCFCMLKIGTNISRTHR